MDTGDKRKRDAASDQFVRYRIDRVPTEINVEKSLETLRFCRYDG